MSGYPHAPDPVRYGKCVCVHARALIIICPFDYYLPNEFACKIVSSLDSDLLNCISLFFIFCLDNCVKCVCVLPVCFPILLGEREFMCESIWGSYCSTFSL